MCTSLSRAIWNPDLLDRIRQNHQTMYRHIWLYMVHWTGHLESFTPGTRQYKMVCTGTSQYVPYSIQGRTRNIKMVHTSTYQHRFLPNPGRIWQNGKDMSEPCTDIFLPVQEGWTCTYHICTCLYHVHKICNCTYVLVYICIFTVQTCLYIFQYSTLFWQHPACKLLLSHCWMHHSSTVRCLLL
jgi:hypothetical protein